MNKQELVDKVIEQIKNDIEMQDYTAIDEMLSLVDETILTNFLSEE